MQRIEGDVHNGMLEGTEKPFHCRNLTLLREDWYQKKQETESIASPGDLPSHLLANFRLELTGKSFLDLILPETDTTTRLSNVPIVYISGGWRSRQVWESNDKCHTLHLAALDSLYLRRTKDSREETSSWTVDFPLRES